MAQKRGNTSVELVGRTVEQLCAFGFTPRQAVELVLGKLVKDERIYFCPDKPWTAETVKAIGKLAKTGGK